MEVVTTRGHIGVVALVLLASFLAPLASAAPIVYSPTVAPMAFNATMDRVVVRFPYIEEDCYGPYRLICVGPYEEQDIVVSIGRTGVGVAENDTGAFVLVDKDRVQPYGPYIINNPLADDGIGDDINVCYWQCLFPQPVYARAHGNVTLTLYAAGREVRQDARVDAEVGGIGSFPFPPPFGCPGYQYPCP